MNVKYNLEDLQMMKLFENMTHSKIKDCIVEEEKIIFVVEQGELRQALGKGAENVKRVGEKFRKRIKIVEFSNDLKTFIKNFIHPLKVDAMNEEEGVVTLESIDTKTKGLLIGRAAKNLRALEKNIQRFFPTLKEIKVA